MYQIAYADSTPQDLDVQAKEAIEKRSAGLRSTEDKTIRRVDLFETILSSKSLPDSEKTYDRIAQEGFVALVAGGETTGRALTVATYHILANRDIVLPRLMEELYKVMPAPDTRASLRELENLPWLVRHHESLAGLKGYRWLMISNLPTDCSTQRVASNACSCYLKTATNKPEPINQVP